MKKYTNSKIYSFAFAVLVVLASCLTAQKANAQSSFGEEMIQIDQGGGNMAWVSVGIGSGQVSQNLFPGQAIYNNAGQYLGTATGSYQQGAPAGYINAGTYDVGNGMTVSYGGGNVTITWPDGSNISTSGGNYTAGGSSGTCTGCTSAGSAADYAIAQQTAAGYNVSSQIPDATSQMNNAAGNGDWLMYQYYYYYLYFINNGPITSSNSTTKPPPPPPPPPSEASQGITPACGNLTFISPEGTPITLPPGSTIGTISLDNGIFSNGALYSFTTPDGTEYMAKEINNYTNSNSSTPMYGGYYKIIIVNGQRTWDNAPSYPFTYPTPNNGVVQAVRLRKDANCNLVQEPVNYTVGGGPASPGAGNVSQNDDIESAPTTGPACGSPTPLPPGSCTGGASNNDAGSDKQKLYNYVQGNSNPNTGLSLFLKAFTKNSVKVYFSDCQTGKVTNSIDNTSSQTYTTPAQQDAATAQYNATPTTSDPDIAIKASVCGGKWNYDVKFNRSKLTPDARIAPVLEQVITEIKAQADDEVKKLKTPGESTNGENANVGNGEFFNKRSMDLIQAVAAIYDIGKDVINTGSLPDKLWDKGLRSGAPDNDAQNRYGRSPYKIPTIMGGAADQLINEATGAVQLVKTGYEVMRHPVKSATGIWNTVSTLDFTKVKQMIADGTGITNYTMGGDRAKYQGAKNAVQVAMIIISGLKDVAEGAEAIGQAGKQVEDIQTFVPPGTTNGPAAAVLENSTANHQLVQDLNSEKLLTTNVVSATENDIKVVAKDGEVFSEKAVNSLDNIEKEVLETSSPEDILASTSDPVVNNQMKAQPQQFKDGKAFEKNIDNDPAHQANVQLKSGVDLTTYTKASGQVQINLPDGSWMIADNVWYKEVAPNQFKIVINETKLSDLAPISANQQKLIDQLATNPNFTIRSAKFGANLPQGANVTVESMVKTVGDGTTGISNYNVIKIH